MLSEASGASDRQRSRAGLEPVDFFDRGGDAVTDLLEVGAMSDELHFVVEELQNDLGLIRVKHETVLGVSAFGSKLPVAYVLHHLDLATCGFEAVDCTDEEVAWAVTVERNNALACDGRAVFVRPLVGFGIRIFEM